MALSSSHESTAVGTISQLCECSMSDSTNSLHSSTISLPSSSCDIFEKYTEDYLQGPFKRCLFPAVGLTEFPGNVKSTEGVRRLRGPYRKYTLSEKQ